MKAKNKKNIEITYEEAVELYKQGGQMKDLALRIYSEEELRSKLPSTWEEFCILNRCVDGEYYVDRYARIDKTGRVSAPRSSKSDRTLLTSEKQCEAIIALSMLIRLRDQYRNGWEPDYMSEKETMYCIVNKYWCHTVDRYKGEMHLLTFQREDTARIFMNNFMDLIVAAGDLI